jgi:hypothetical protein
MDGVHDSLDNTVPCDCVFCHGQRKHNVRHYKIYDKHGDEYRISISSLKQQIEIRKIKES